MRQPSCSVLNLLAEPSRPSPISSSPPRLLATAGKMRAGSSRSRFQTPWRGPENDLTNGRDRTRYPESTSRVDARTAPDHDVEQYDCRYVTGRIRLARCHGVRRRPVKPVGSSSELLPARAPAPRHLCHHHQPRHRVPHRQGRRHSGTFPCPAPNPHDLGFRRLRQGDRLSVDCCRYADASHAGSARRKSADDLRYRASLNDEDDHDREADMEFAEPGSDQLACR